MWRGFHSAKFQVKQSFYVLIGVQKYYILAVTAMEYKISWCQKHQQTLTFPTLLSFLNSRGTWQHQGAARFLCCSENSAAAGSLFPQNLGQHSINYLSELCRGGTKCPGLMPSKILQLLPANFLEVSIKLKVGYRWPKMLSRVMPCPFFCFVVRRF